MGIYSANQKDPITTSFQEFIFLKNLTDCLLIIFRRQSVCIYIKTNYRLFPGATVTLKFLMEKQKSIVVCLGPCKIITIIHSVVKNPQNVSFQSLPKYFQSMFCVCWFAATRVQAFTTFILFIFLGKEN